MLTSCLSLLLCISSFAYPQNIDTIPLIEVPEALNTYLLFDDAIEVFLDSESEFSLNEVLQFSGSVFSKPAQIQLPNASFSIWSRLQFKNTSTASIREYLQLCTDADSIWVYRIEAKAMVEMHLAGSALKPSEKYFPSLVNYVPFHLDAGETTTYYIKTWFSKNMGKDHLYHLNLSPDDEITTSSFRAIAKEAFYAGVMVLFFLLSTFLYVMFRDKSLLFYGILMLFFIPYFWEIDRVVYPLFDITNNPDFSPMVISISGLVIFGFLFVSNYIRLSTHYPKYYRVYRFFSYLTVAFPYLFNWLSPGQSGSLIHNILLGIWILLMLIPVITLSRKKDRPAQILLVSAGSLLLSALVHVIYLTIVPYAKEWNTVGFQIGTLIFSGTLLYGLFDKVKDIRLEKQRVEELDGLKTRFFANISHEFRTPLTLMMGPVKQVMEKQSNTEDRNLLRLAYNNAQRLLQLINQLLDLSKLEAGKMQLQATKQNFAVLLKGLVVSFESLAVRKDIRLHFVSQQDDISLYVEQDKIEKIFYNLLSNAFKFTPTQGEVSVLLLNHDREIEVVVKDNGIGIPAGRLSHIFNRFFQVDTEVREQEGTGIGLALVKELVELHHGTIKVESEVDKGTSFTIVLPKGKTHLQENELSSENATEHTEKLDDSLTMDSSLEIDNIEVSTETDFLEGIGMDSDKPTVLIIEDNQDVRNYIKQHLLSSFQIIEAINGQEGVDKTLEHQPDLVISDVMMPKKNGYEVCYALKTDPRSSHIPVILLTAKAALEEKLVGLETGADDYLVKPFDTKELEVRVRNLISQRVQLRKRFSEAGSLQEKTKGLNEVDQVFLEKVLSLVEKHLDDSQFGVETLADEVNMSKVHLNRKLKALTDLSPNKFIQAYRLQKALELLQKGTGSVAEIAFETGFSSSAYFVKCFREKYGKTPGAILGD